MQLAKQASSYLTPVQKYATMLIILLLKSQVPKKVYVLYVMKAKLI